MKWDNTLLELPIKAINT